MAGILTALLMAEFAFKHRLIINAPLTAEGGFDYNEQYRLAAEARGEAYDPRTLVELISTERLKNKRVFPAASPAYFLNANGSSVIVDSQPVLPLGITALADNYYCNESGKFANFVTDQYGFRNEKSVWSNNVDIVAIGDSFTMGSCLDDDLSIVGQLRASGKKVLNLGMGSNGPLLELASLKEFGLQAKPKIILWNFFVNDLFDLHHEKNNPILIKYLNENFSQNLKKNFAKINPAVDVVVEEYWKKIEALAKNRPDHSLSETFLFPNIQKVYRYLRNQSLAPSLDKKENIELLLEVLKRAAAESKKMNALLIFVYLPDCNDNSYGQQSWKPELLAAIQAFGIKTIDLSEAIHKMKTSGKAAYYACPGSHFNSAGAKAASEEILQMLNSIKN